jgi:hypothetical protein
LVQNPVNNDNGFEFMNPWKWKRYGGKWIIIDFRFRVIGVKMVNRNGMEWEHEGMLLLNVEKVFR